MSQIAKSLKVNGIIASVFPISFFTLFIYPFVIGIMLCVNSHEFENSGLAIATGVLMFFVLPIVLFIPLILSCCLRPK